MDTFVGDIVTISLETLVNLTGYSRYIKFRRPDGTKGVWPASIDPLDNSKMYYTTDETDLNQAGTWKIQAYATGVNYNAHGRIVDMIVRDAVSTLTTAAPTTAAP